MTYALLSMSERHGLLAGIMCAGASPVPACAELTQPPAWFFAAVARPCLWAVGVQLPPHLAASASCCVTWRSCCGGSLRRRRPACRGSLASELLSRRGPCRRPGRKSTTAGGTTAKMASCFLIVAFPQRPHSVARRPPLPETHNHTCAAQAHEPGRLLHHI